MSLFDIGEPIDYQWLIENGFSQRIRNGNNNPHILTKILRYRNPYVYININNVTLDTTLKWLNVGSGTRITSSTQSLFLGRIDDRLKMLSIISKYSQENCLI